MEMAVSTDPSAQSALTAPQAGPGSVAPSDAGHRWLVRALRSVMVLWAGAWCLFAGLSAASEGWPAVPYATAFLALTAAPVAAAWRYPRVGGLAMIVLGVASLFFFNYPFTQATLGGPAIVLGLCGVVLGRRSR